MVDKKKRDFIITTTTACGAGGVLIGAWPFFKSMAPSADILANATKEVGLSSVSSGQSIKVMWQGKPVYIRNRAEKEIKEAEDTDIAKMRDPEPDKNRVKDGKKNWLVVVGICTHLGCVPISNQDGTFFCPCHGSYYDTSGRIVRGPAPSNLAVPDYYFVNDDSIIIGAKQQDV